MQLEHIVEALIFASPDGVTAREMARVIGQAAADARARQREASREEGSGEESPPVLDAFENAVLEHAQVTDDQVTAAIVSLVRGYEESQRAFTLLERPTGWRIAARPEYAPWVRQLFPEKKPTRLTPSALETLAIVAYRQPVTKASIEAVRGVSVDGPMQTLLDRNIIRIAGRADLPGRPLLYETTDLFLEYIGIRNVDELPNAAELRSVRLPEPEIEAPEATSQAQQPELPLDNPPPPEQDAAPAAETAEEVESTSLASSEAIEPAPSPAEENPHADPPQPQPQPRKKRGKKSPPDTAGQESPQNAETPAADAPAEEL